MLEPFDGKCPTCGQGFAGYLLEAFDLVPDVALGKWGGTPGPVWEPARRALKAHRKAQGFDCDAPLDDFDRGWLRLRGTKAIEDLLQRQTDEGVFR